MRAPGADRVGSRKGSKSLSVKPGKGAWNDGYPDTHQLSGHSRRTKEDDGKACSPKTMLLLLSRIPDRDKRQSRDTEDDCVDLLDCGCTSRILGHQ